MFYYKIYGMTIESDYELNEANKIVSDSFYEIDIVICKGKIEKKYTEELEDEKGKKLV